MTIAITPFEGLCGFRPLNELSHFLTSVPSLSALVGEDNAKTFTTNVSGHEDDTSPEQVEKNKKALQKVFTALMTSEAASIASAAKELVASAEKEGERFAGGGGPSNTGKELAELVVRLNGQFEGDIGLFVLFFCNYVKLEVGEAMFLKADDIHAYLSGGKSPFYPPNLPYLPSFPVYTIIPLVPGKRYLPLDSSSLFNPEYPTPLYLGLTLQSRYHRMHGLLRQRRPRRLHPQTQGHPHPHLHADLLLLPSLGAEDVPHRLPLRHPQHHRILLLLLINTLRPAHRRIRRRQDGLVEEGRQGNL